MGVTRSRFNSGEWSPELQARYDLDGYAGACKQMLNFIAKPEGGAYNRGGMKYVSSGLTLGDNTRCIPFVYGNTQEYMLVFTDSGTIYVLKDKTPLLSGGVPVEVTNGHPLAASAIGQMDYAQTEDTIYFTHSSVGPFSITRDTSDETDWTRTTISFGSSISRPDAPTDGTNNPSSLYFYVSLVSAATGEESLMSLGELAIGGDVLTFGTITDEYYYKVFILNEATGNYHLAASMLPGSYIYTVASTLDVEDYPIGYPYVLFGLSGQYSFDAAGGYPSLVTVHDQRLVFAATVNNPRKVFMSQVGLPTNFQYAGDLRATDSFAFDLSTPAGEELSWLVSRESLLIGTTQAEYVVKPASGGATITATSIDARANSRFGSIKYVKPEEVGQSVLFADRTGEAVRAQEYTYTSEGYAAPDVGIRSRHLFNGLSITSMAYQKNILWAVVSGKLLGMTYDRDQSIYAWHRHNTGALGFDTFGSVAVLRNRTTGKDELYIFNKTRGSVEVLTEHLPADERFRENDDLADLKQGNFLDYSVTSDVGAADITGVTLGTTTTLTISAGHGLTSGDENSSFIDISGIPYVSGINGRFRFEYVSATQIIVRGYEPLTTDILSCDKLETDSSVVSSIDLTNIGGSLRVPVSSHSGFTHLYGQSGVYAVVDGIVDTSPTVSVAGVITTDPPASIAHAGIPYTAKLKPVDFLYDTQSGSIVSKDRLISSAVFTLKNTQCIQVANTENDSLTDYSFPDAEVYGEPRPLFNGDIEVFIEGETERASSLYIQCDSPVSCHVLRVTAEVTPGDN